MDEKDKGCLCGEKQYAFLLKGKQFSILKCKRCGLSRTHPRPEPDYEGPEGIPTRDMKTEKLARKFAMNILKQILPHKKSGKLLDIGCGKGMVLYCAKQLGFDPTGIELSKTDSEYARKFLGVKAITRNIFKADIREKYDVIVMNHFLEHIEDPAKILAKAKSLLREGGIIFIGLPNVDSAWRKIQGETWYPYQHKQHIWHYGPSTLKKILDQSGLRAKQVIITTVEHSLLLKPMDLFFGAIGLGDNLSIIAVPK